MSKRQIEAMIPKACKAIKECGLSDGKKVDGKLRAQISSFGAAVTMGNLLSAVAFFSNKGGADSERQLLMKAIYYIISKPGEKASEPELLTMLVDSPNPDTYKENIIDAAIAIKLAMNMFDLDKGQASAETEGA